MGYVSISFDAPEHGERGHETADQIFSRVFENFRKFMWKIIGNTAIDLGRVINWTMKKYGNNIDLTVPGLSMGGDVSIVSGTDERISRIIAVVATPDWKRPGMEYIGKPGGIVSQGEPDSYALHFYNEMNPVTNLSK